MQESDITYILSSVETMKTKGLHTGDFNHPDLIMIMKHLLQDGKHEISIQGGNDGSVWYVLYAREVGSTTCSK